VPLKEIKFYLIQGPHRGKYAFRSFSPKKSGRWGNIVSVDDINDAKYVVVVQSSDIDLSHFPPERIVYIQREPDEFIFAQHMWDWVSSLSYRFNLVDNYAVQQWDAINKSYDELKNMDFPVKTKDLSWVTSNKGDGSQPPGIQVLTGHKLRMRFLQNFLSKFPDKIDLYGRGLLGPKYDYKCNKGELFYKWDGHEEYRYTLSFENSSQRGLFSIITDGILAGCMPIYWGCLNLEDFFPKGSFIRLDITKEDAPERAIEIARSDFRERNLDALREAKELIIDKYNIWPTVHRILNELEVQNAPH